jgi:hypothetical protein
MIILKIAGLAFWAFYAYSMGQVGTLNAFGEAVAFSFFLVAPWLYLFPTYEAWLRNSKNLTSIALVNILLGWSIVGWVVAMVWAIKEPPPLDVDKEYEKALPSAAKATKVCPYCAEEILVNAKICKHCKSNVEEMLCPHCQGRFLNRPDLAGKQGTCPTCNGSFTYI